MDLSGGYYDISPPIGEGTAVFPGDTPFSRKTSQDFVRGDAIYLSALSSTPHIGAHADGPNHYQPGAPGIDGVSLEFYLGPCQVIETRARRGERIRPADLLAEARVPRVLLKTGSYPDPQKWNADFNSLSAELIEALAGRGVKLIGIDTPSVDPADDKTLESHHALWRFGMRNLEGLDLREVPPGAYTLVALPLRIQAGDASPVRAILIKSAARSTSTSAGSRAGS